MTACPFCEDGFLVVPDPSWSTDRIIRSLNGDHDAPCAECGGTHQISEERLTQLRAVLIGERWWERAA